MSIVMGISAPFFWTAKAYYLRLCSSPYYNYKIFDVTIDSQFVQALLNTIGYFVLTLVNDSWYPTEIAEGSIAAFMFLIGNILAPIALNYGPGGPINALICT